MFLAGKVEETPKSLSDLLKVSTAVKHKDEDGTACSLMQDSNFVQEQRELVLRAERRLLHSLAFDFNIEHPYKYLLSTVKQMQGYCRISESSTRELAQTAWNFANDR
jgi:cyclin T